MRFVCLRLFVAMVLVISIVSCGGGGNSNTVGAPAKVTLAPSTVSLNFGQFTSLLVTVQDANDAINRTATVTAQSSKPEVATVRVATDPNTGGTLIFVCAGQWNSEGTVCTPATTFGVANITATAGTITSTATVATVHAQVANVLISAVAPAPGCVSQNGTTKTQQHGASVFDNNGNNITFQVGPITWVSTDTTVATIDAASGLATAKRPGRSNIFASVGNVNSAIVPFFTCSPASIELFSTDVTPRETSFSLAPQASKQLTAVATDTNGVFMNDPGLTFISNVPGVAGVNPTGALVTAVAAGTARILAECLAPNCNNGLGRTIFSNPVNVTVTGTLSPRVYVTGKNSTTVVPIDPATNVPGTGVTIPQISVNGTNTQPVLTNAMFSKDGRLLFIGSDRALFVFDTTTNQFTSSNSTMVGNVLAVSPSNVVAVAELATSTVRLYSASNGTVIATVGIADPRAADFSPDGQRLFVVGAGGITVFAISSSQSIPLAQVGNDIAILNQGSVGYVASGTPSNLDVFSTCDNDAIGTIPVAGDLRFVEATEDSTTVFAIDKQRIYEVAVTLNSTGCPPSVTNTLAPAVDFGIGQFTPRQLIASQNGSRAFVVSDKPNVLAYNATSDTPATIPLAGGATSAFSGGILPDGSQLYVGAAGTNDVHRIDVAAGTDAQQIAVNLKKTDNTATAPDIVLVKPR
jgi:hypothetical protein